MQLDDFKKITHDEIRYSKEKLKRKGELLSESQKNLFKKRFMPSHEWDSSNFDHLDELESQKNIQREQQLKNFDLNFSIETKSCDFFLINSKSMTEDLPFFKANTFPILGRDSDIALDMSIIKRVPRIIAKYENILGIDVNSEELTDLHSNIKQELLKDINVRSKELFYERVDNDLIDIFGMMDEEQQRIIERFNKKESVWIRGFAGSGKTVIANELLSRIETHGHAKLALYANEEGKKKAQKFFNSINQGNIKVFTYNDLITQISKNVRELVDAYLGGFSEFKDSPTKKISFYLNNSRLFDAKIGNWDIVEFIVKKDLKEENGVLSLDDYLKNKYNYSIFEIEKEKQEIQFFNEIFKNYDIHTSEITKQGGKEAVFKKWKTVISKIKKVARDVYDFLESNDVKIENWDIVEFIVKKDLKEENGVLSLDDYLKNKYNYSIFEIEKENHKIQIFDDIFKKYDNYTRIKLKQDVVKIWKTAISKIKNNAGAIYEFSKNVDGKYEIDKSIFFPFEKVYSFFNDVEFTLLDEAPILSKHTLLFKPFYKKTLEGMRYISAFDEFQYDKEAVKVLWRYAHYDRKEFLQIVYRTTKEIFSIAANAMNFKHWNAPVSEHTSVIYSQHALFNKVIKLSNVLKSFDSFIGLEFKELSLEIDVELKEEQLNIFYVAVTRAVKTLNIFGDKQNLIIFNHN